MSSRTSVRLVATGARLVAGVVVSAACVAGAVIAIPAAWPTIAHTPAHSTVKPVAGDTLLSCTGSFLALGRDAAQASQLSVAGSPNLVSGASAGETLTPGELGMSDVVGTTSAPAFTASPQNRESALAAAAQSVTVSADAPRIDVTDGEVKQTMRAKEIENLPTPDQSNFLRLASIFSGYWKSREGRGRCLGHSSPLVGCRAGTRRIARSGSSLSTGRVQPIVRPARRGARRIRAPVSP